MPPVDPARCVVRLSDVCREVGLSPATMRRLCKDGRGPRLLQLSERRYGVRRGDLDAWVASREITPEQKFTPGNDSGPGVQFREPQG